MNQLFMYLYNFQQMNLHSIRLQNNYPLNYSVQSRRPCEFIAKDQILVKKRIIP